METPEGHQRCLFNASKVKKQRFMGSIRRNLQAQPKMLKKKFGTSYQPIRINFIQSEKEPKLRIRPGSLKNNRTQVKLRKP
jgi:hypothetical protein